ncbi:hypothetical protein [Lentilactobacillus kisonensis]|uniref:hypothetical protein n=1 Tax=Lentilactobacillus kisonensis TaxID=481722 RepID=UPI000A5DB73A|nr:hypothetical protein [Lentilactobacillus kisonensis]
MTDLRWQIGYVLQQIALFPTMTVAKNVSVVPDMQRVSGRKVRGLVDNLLAEVGLMPVFETGCLLSFRVVSSSGSALSGTCRETANYLNG